MRAFANGVEILPDAWLVEGLPTLLHLSLCLFFAGTIIFLFNTNHAVFCSFIRQDSSYYSPLSSEVWPLYAGILYKTLFYIRSERIVDFRSRERLQHFRDRYRDWSSGSREKAAEETVSK